MNEYTVQLVFDVESGTWYAESDDIPGLILGARDVETLIKRVKLAAPEIMELNGVPAGTIRFQQETAVA